MSKPSFDQFHLALLHESERQRFGIPLDTVGAFQILRDETSARKYYQAWTPTFGPRPIGRGRPNTAQQKQRTALGWVMLVVVVLISIAIVVVAGSALYSLVTNGAKPGQLSFPDWWKPW